MTSRLFGRKKANRKIRKPELRVVEGVDLRSRRKEHEKICGYMREMFPEDAEDNKKPLA